MPAPAPVKSPALDGFSEATRAWFAAAFAEPTQAQAQAWVSIGNGENAVVIAATGSGKTVAAFLWAIDNLATQPVPADPRQRCRVLYISPLKALAVDIERNLRSPLTGVGHAARRLGLPEPDIRVGVRTGDTAADERRKLSGQPPDILITTPDPNAARGGRATDGPRGWRRLRRPPPPRAIHSAVWGGRATDAEPTASATDRAVRDGPAARGGRVVPRRRPPGHDRPAAEREADRAADRRSGRGHGRPGDGRRIHRPRDWGRAGAGTIRSGPRPRD